jgi:hypothetical protein
MNDVPGINDWGFIFPDLHREPEISPGTWKKSSG